MIGKSLPPFRIHRETGKFLIIADLHLDLWKQEGRDPFEGLGDVLNSDLDFLLIAGDLTNKPKTRWTPFLSDLGERVGPGKVLVFPGNHDYYQYRLDAEDRLATFAEAAGAKFVQQRDIRYGKDRFLCCTLWTDFRLGHASLEVKDDHAMRIMNDYRAIRLGGSGFGPCRPHHTRQAHTRHLFWLKERLAEPFEGTTRVVTHHAPSPRSLAPDLGHGVDYCYASELDDLILTEQMGEWIHGHTHHPVDYSIGKTRVSSVSLGYPGQNPRPPRDKILSFMRGPEPEVSPGQDFSF